MKHLNQVVSYSDGLYEAAARDYVTYNLHKRITMDAYFKHALSFSIHGNGTIQYSNDYVRTPNTFLIEGLKRIGRECLVGLPGLEFLDLGFVEEVAGSLYFHVYDARFNERNLVWI
ncbi:hypothetical protein CZP2022_207 [Vibrio phage C-ZP2022]|nr:hypothetical protein CZP2022_207 [Vibrio phage C-ZP2022]